MASLQKQLSAYENDLSEETQAKVQQLRVSIEDAQKNLDETNYDKFISDQQQLLDSLYEEYETVLNQRLDNIDALISDMIAEINNSSDIISTTLSEKAESVGYTLSDNMSNIWTAKTAETNTILTTYGENIKTGISSATTSLNNTLNTINVNLSSMIEQLNSIAKTNVKAVSTISSITSSSSSGTANTTGNLGNQPATSTSQNNTNTGNNNSGGWGSWFIKKKDSYPKGSLNKETSIVDRLKYFDFDSSYYARSQYYSAMGGSGVYTSSASQNVWMVSEMRRNGFAKGGTIGELINKTGETGFVLARTGEEILSLEKINALGDAFAKMNPVINNMSNLYKDLIPSNIPNIKDKENRTYNEIHLENVVLPNITNYDEFKHKLLRDKDFEKGAQAVTINRFTGASSLKKYSV